MLFSQYFRMKTTAKITAAQAAAVHVITGTVVLMRVKYAPERRLATRLPVRAEERYCIKDGTQTTPVIRPEVKVERPKIKAFFLRSFFGTQKRKYVPIASIIKMTTMYER